MKKIVLIAALALGTYLVSAQAPEKMSYQSIVRNASGQLLSNQNVAVRVSVLQGSASGTVVYSERITGTTNVNGLVSLEIGSGTVLSGTFSTINWGGNSYYLKTETDPAGGTNYTVTGTSQLLSVPYALYAKSAGGGGGSFVLPYTNTLTNATDLFTLANNGDGSSIVGQNNATTSSISAVRGEVTSTSPGGFSSAVKGMNNGTGGLGIGVWGSQAGSGWGVYGVTPNGLGVYGNSSASGTGVYANSTAGTGLTATSTNGIPASIAVFNNANNNNVLNASTVGNGTVINVSTTGSGEGIQSSTIGGFAIHGIANQQSSAGIVGDNDGNGEAVVGRTTSNIAGAVVGRNDGGGYGVRGFISGNASGTAVGVLGQIGTNSSKGRAGRFENLNSSNDKNTFEVESNGNGNIPDNTQGNVASFLSSNTNSVSAGVRSEVKTIFGNFGAAGIFGVSSGTGGFGGLFHASNTTGNGRALVAISDGNGDAFLANAGKDGDAVEASVDGAGRAVYGWVPSFSTGKAAEFKNFNTSNTNPVLTSTSVGNSIAGDFFVDNTNGTSAALHGKVNSIFANFGTAGVYGESVGTGGYAGLFYQRNVSSGTSAVIVLNDGTADALTVNATQNGDGISTSVNGTGSAIEASVPNFGLGRAGYFRNFNTANGQSTLAVTNAGTGSAFFVNHTGASGNLAVFQSESSNMARINKAGRGFFNGGTQNSGADVAEAFDVEGHFSTYEAGDILVISTDSDRTVTKSAEPYSSLVAGVYATKPGVLLTEENIDSELIDKVPMGVIGVIPTKVCLEGGAIKRGDLLVTSSVPGVAMKGDAGKIKIGQVLGKALQDYNNPSVGKIKVLVSIK